MNFSLILLLLFVFTFPRLSLLLMKWVGAWIQYGYKFYYIHVYNFFLYDIFGGPKSLPKGFTISTFEFTKPMDYLHATYPGKNDAEILQIREEENYKMMKGIVQKQYGKKASVDEHFSFKVFYSMGSKPELVVQTKPKTAFAQLVLKEIMNVRMKTDKYTSIVDADDEN